MTMTREEAKAIVEEERPGLFIDEKSRPDLTYLLSLYRKASGPRHNLDLRELTPDDLRHHIANL